MDMEEANMILKILHGCTLMREATPDYDDDDGECYLYHLYDNAGKLKRIIGYWTFPIESVVNHIIQDIENGKILL
jgi:hypothetical protein